MENNQDTKYNYKIILAAMAAVILGILIAFYYSYAQSRTQISYLEHEKDLLVKDITLIKADVDRLTALDEVNDIELQTSRYKVQQLIDSVGKLSFTIGKLREFKTELRRLATKNDSLKLKNDFLNYNNEQLAEKFKISQKDIKKVRATNAALAEALKRGKKQGPNKKLIPKKYLKLETTVGSAQRVRSGKTIQTNKASTVRRLKGSIIIAADNEAFEEQERVLYFQFLGPNMGIIEDNANTINVKGNVYSKRVAFNFTGEQTQVENYISIPEGSLESGGYTLNIFEDQRLLQSSQFELK